MAPSRIGSIASESVGSGRAVAATMLAMSIGWGIRGSYGHENGAMIAGALGALAICLFSGREAWLRRAPLFGLFGALGWAFGGSMAYMPTISYTHSGHWPTQVYGWFAVFAIGGLWTAMGAAGVAYAGAEERERLEALVKPLGWVLAVWTVQYFWPKSDGDFRQRDPFYWLDSDWVEAGLAIAALCAFELWDRRFRNCVSLFALTAVGAAAGLGVQRLLEAIGLMPAVLRVVVHPQGDAARFDPANLVTNWPQVFADHAPHVGWVAGAILGAAIWFRWRGHWRSGSLLLMHIACGAMITLMALPVLLGIRMVPPRGDSWAMTLGALIGTVIYMRKNGLKPVANAALTGCVLGGCGFMLAQFAKLLALMPGNPVITRDSDTVNAWSHWHSANWHSILAEQGAGLLYGLALWLAVRPLAASIPDSSTERRNRRVEVFATAFILILIPYVNLVKNVAEWTRERAGGYRAMAATMKAPLLGWDWTAAAWFNFFAAIFAAALFVILVAHVRRGVGAVPATWTGKTQVLLLAFLWIMVFGNLGRLLGGFVEGRLATEGFVTVNAVILSVLVLLGPARSARPTDWNSLWPARKVIIAGLVAVLICAGLFTGVMQFVYGPRHDGFGGRNVRFGPEADWRVRPLLKNLQHR